MGDEGCDMVWVGTGGAKRAVVWMRVWMRLQARVGVIAGSLQACVCTGRGCRLGCRRVSRPSAA